MGWLTGGVARKKRALCRRLYSQNPSGFLQMRLSLFSILVLSCQLSVVRWQWQWQSAISNYSDTLGAEG
jgi:hypothetical protein